MALSTPLSFVLKPPSAFLSTDRRSPAQTDPNCTTSELKGLIDTDLCGEAPSGTNRIPMQNPRVSSSMGRSYRVKTDTFIPPTASGSDIRTQHNIPPTASGSDIRTHHNGVVVDEDLVAEGCEQIIPTPLAPVSRNCVRQEHVTKMETEIVLSGASGSKRRTAKQNLPEDQVIDLRPRLERHGVSVFPPAATYGREPWDTLRSERVNHTYKKKNGAGRSERNDKKDTSLDPDTRNDTLIAMILQEENAVAAATSCDSSHTLSPQDDQVLRDHELALRLQREEELAIKESEKAKTLYREHEERHYHSSALHLSQHYPSDIMSRKRASIESVGSSHLRHPYQHSHSFHTSTNSRVRTYPRGYHKDDGRSHYGRGEDSSYEALLELEDVSVGLDPKVINTRSTTYTMCKDTKDTRQMCTVCLEPFQDGDLIRVLPCFHSFHVKCIDQWLSQSKLCPICTKDVEDLGTHH